MLTGIKLVDRIKVPTKRKMTDAGQMHVPCKFARTGTQLYTAGQLGLVDKAPNELVEVHRAEDQVFDEDSISSFRSAPVTIGHPTNDDGEAIAVSAENAKELQVGMLEGMPVRDEDTLGGTLILTTQEAIDALEGGTQELSAGYTCDIMEVDGELHQQNIRANHIAIVSKGRAGSSCRISDEALAVQEAAAQALEDLNKSSKIADEEGGQESVDGAVEMTDADMIVKLNDERDAAIALYDEAMELIEKLNEDAELSRVELADAKLAASEGVIERCEAIESARLVADMRDLGDKSVAEIKRIVVSDQKPEINLDGKSEDYIAALFDMLVDGASGGPTPMQKLMDTQDSHFTAKAKYVNPVEEARNSMIARSKK